MTQFQPPSDPHKPRGQVSGVQLTFAVILAVGMILALNFSSRITANQPLYDEYYAIQEEIAALRREQEALIQRRDYVRSDAYAERWARSDGKMVRPGEVLIVPVPAASDAVVSAPNPAASAFQQVQTTPPEPETWEVWWALFFDSQPPDF